VQYVNYVNSVNSVTSVNYPARHVVVVVDCKLWKPCELASKAGGVVEGRKSRQVVVEGSC